MTIDPIQNNEGLGSVRDKLNELIAQQDNVFTSTENGLVPAPGVISGKVLRDDGTWVANGGGGGGTPGGSSGQIQYNNVGAFGGFTMSGDATVDTSTGVLSLVSVNSNVGTFGLAGSVSQFVVNAKGLITSAANVAISIASTAISDSTAAGRAMLTAATSAAQTALLNIFTASDKGLVPAPGAVTGKVLSDNGTWVTPAGGVVDGTYGEIVVSSSGTVWTIGASAVDLSQMADLPALTLIGNATAASATPQALTAADIQTIINMSMGVLQARAQGVGVI